MILKRGVLVKAKQLRDCYAEWLSSFRWQLFATLTFRRFPSSSRANRIFRLWTDEMRSAVGTSSFRWFRVTEYGSSGTNLHYHAFIGGLRDATKWPWLFRWEELAGEADIFYFSPAGGAVQYSLKTLHEDRDFEIEFDFPNVHELHK
jgi:hypothetical protein